MTSTDGNGRGHLESRVVSALDAFSAQSSSANHDDTCRAIERYVDHLRAAALTPEGVVIELKAVTRRAGFRLPKDTSLRPNMNERDLLAEQFISCGIRRYFSRDADVDAPQSASSTTTETSMGHAKASRYLAHQTRDFHDGAGHRWSVRIEQDGGRRSATNGPPTPRLIFSAREDPTINELAVVGDAASWELSSYSEARLRTLLTQAQARASDRES